jgi:hypothetical protein
MKSTKEMRVAYHPRLVSAKSAPHGAVIKR